MKAENIFKRIPENLREDIVCSGIVRIERIISTGQASPETGWYDQAESESSL